MTEDDDTLFGVEVPVYIPDASENLDDFDDYFDDEFEDLPYDDLDEWEAREE